MLFRARALELGQRTEHRSLVLRHKHYTYYNKQGHLESQYYIQYPELRPNNTSNNNKAENTSNNSIKNNPRKKDSFKENSKAIKESPRVLLTSLANKGNSLGINSTKRNNRIILDSGASEHYTLVKE